ncbi:hypothetical protein MRX96_058334 [Rhipicephalus microplus]
MVRTSCSTPDVRCPRLGQRITARGSISGARTTATIDSASPQLDRGSQHRPKFLILSEKQKTTTMKATIFSVALVVILLTTAFGCDHMGYRRDAGRCRTKHETNLQQASASQRCCAFYVLSECLKLASRYSDCPQGLCHGGAERASAMLAV